MSSNLEKYMALLGKLVQEKVVFWEPSSNKYPITQEL